MRRVVVLALTGGLALAAGAWAATNGAYNGPTSQRYGAINLDVSGGHVTSGGFRATSSCSKTPQETRFHSNIAIKNDKFSATGMLIGPNDHLTISGTFTGTKVKGSFSDAYRYLSKTCRTGTVTYSATRQ